MIVETLRAGVASNKGLETLPGSRVKLLKETQTPTFRPRLSRTEAQLFPSTCASISLFCNTCTHLVESPFMIATSRVLQALISYISPSQMIASSRLVSLVGWFFVITGGFKGSLPRTDAAKILSSLIDPLLKETFWDLGHVDTAMIVPPGPFGFPNVPTQREK